MSKFTRKLQKINERRDRDRAKDGTTPPNTELPVARFNEGRWEALDGADVAAPRPTGGLDTDGSTARHERNMANLQQTGRVVPPEFKYDHAKLVKIMDIETSDRVMIIDSIGGVGHIPNEVDPTPDRSYKAVRAEKARKKKMAKLRRHQHHIESHLP